MFHVQKSLLVCLFLGFAGPGLAEREVHVVAVGKGIQTQDYRALPEVRVLVDRPGQEVALVLLDGGEVHWKLEATAGTIIGDVVRSGPSPRESKVTFAGIPMAGVQEPGLPLVYRPLGREFRRLVDAVADRMETARLSSFQAVHKAPRAPLRVDHVDLETAGLARDYLAQVVGGLGICRQKFATGSDMKRARRVSRQGLISRA